VEIDSVLRDVGVLADVGEEEPLLVPRNKVKE
jgi:hypothetical protein